ncbi:MAG: hypothetical protein PSX81_14130 [bacterium]|nr:hypothetical protein [bacterium]
MKGAPAREDQLKFSMRGGFFIRKLMRTPSAKFCYFFAHTNDEVVAKLKEKQMNMIKIFDMLYSIDILKLNSR